MTVTPLEGFTHTAFSHGGAERIVYLRGDGPGVVVMHEIPGITPEVARFARIVADDGFRVYLPHLFGTPDKPFSNGYVLGQMARACVSRGVQGTRAMPRRHGDMVPPAARPGMNQANRRSLLTHQIPLQLRRSFDRRDSYPPIVLDID